MNNLTLENYVVERVKKLENEVSALEEERDALINQLKTIDVIKLKMRQYFKLEKYATGRRYIDHSYEEEFLDEIVHFIGLEEQEEDHEES